MKTQPRTRVFSDHEQRVLVEALRSYVDNIDSFLADSEGDDVTTVKSDRSAALALLEELEDDV